jgi:hypothetical protein
LDYTWKTSFHTAFKWRDEKMLPRGNLGTLFFYYRRGLRTCIRTRDPFKPFLHERANRKQGKDIRNFLKSFALQSQLNVGNHSATIAHEFCHLEEEVLFCLYEAVPPRKQGQQLCKFFNEK